MCVAQQGNTQARMWICTWNNTQNDVFPFPDCSLCIRKSLSYKTQCPTCCVVSVVLVWIFPLSLFLSFGKS